ncbi:MAG TPA: AAA family ATPase [Stellaceae bacterium]|nr:AAA family ATPase [Stellaceae bacterium]
MVTGMADESPVSGLALRPPAELIYADELAALGTADTGPRPPGWRLSARAVRRFILGDEKQNVSRKFYGDDALVDRAVVSLMGEQGLMLTGEPGTAKSLLSELLAAAISGSTALVIQGSAGINEDHVRYGWNYALLLAEGPSWQALVPSPVLEAMREGAIIRIEELTRCAPEIQDVLISVLSEKSLAIPELGREMIVRAAPGFNVIATANLRDRGVHEMSSALKRRFNFETVHPIADPALERALIRRQLDLRLSKASVTVDIPDATIDLLVTTFQELRTGRTSEGVAVPRPETVMSTAEAVNVAHAASLEAAFLDEGPVTGGHVARQMQGVVLKDDAEDARKFKAYIDHIGKERARKGGEWHAFYEAARRLKLG